MKTVALKQKQKGVASVLLVLIAGLGIIAAVLGTGAYIRGTQDQHLTTHSMTQAQLRAWEAVEVIRQYLSSLDSTALSNLAVGNLALTGLDGVAATIVSNTPMSGAQRIAVNVTGTGAGASSIVQAVFEVTAGTSGGSGETLSIDDAINIYKDLNLTGSVNFTGDTASSNVNVQGKVSLSGSVSGLNRLCATDDVYITAGIHVESVCTNGNLKLNGSASVTHATVIGNVDMDGGTSIGTALANGNITLQGGHIGDAKTKGLVSLTGGNIDTVANEKDIFWLTGGAAQSISSNGNVNYKGSNNNANNSANIIAIGDVTIDGQGTANSVSTKGNTTLKNP